MENDFEVKEAGEGSQKPEKKKNFKDSLIWIAAVLSLISIISAVVLGLFVLNLNKDVLNLNKEMTDFKTQVKNQENEIANIRDDLKTAKESLDLRISLLQMTLPSDSVDLTAEEFQYINNNFAVRISKVESYLDGVTVKGEILNLNSVTYSNAKFKISTGFLDLTTKNFTITKISPGYSASFSVYLPNIDIKSIKNARITYEEGTISYYRQ